MWEGLLTENWMIIKYIRCNHIEKQTSIGNIIEISILFYNEIKLNWQGKYIELCYANKKIKLA